MGPGSTALETRLRPLPRRSHPCSLFITGAAASLLEPPLGATAARPAASLPRCRPASQPAPFALHHAASGDADPGSGDSVSLARSISKDSLASNVVSLTPQNQPHPTAPKTNGKSLLNNVDIEDEDEELVAIIRTDGAPHGGDRGLTAGARSPQRLADTSGSKPDSFFLEPLMPAVLRPAKEKQAVTKEDEYGEGRPRGGPSRRPGEGHPPLGRRKAPSSHVSRDLTRTFTPISCSELPAGLAPAPTEVGEVHGGPLAGSRFEPSTQGQPADGFFLHVARADEDAEGRLYVSCARSPLARDPEPWAVLRQDSDSDVADLEDAEHDFVGDAHPMLLARYVGEEESAKLQEDMKVKEHEDKDGASGRSSPCLSTVSQVSSVSVASGSVKMTSFAERKFQRLNSYEAKSSTSSSQKTTPDASESSPAPLTTWKQRREQSPGRQSRDHASLLASELVQLHMQLEEKRRAIEAQKKKMEALSARQRLKLGKAAFLHVVKKGKAETAPQPLRPERAARECAQLDSEDGGGGVSKTEEFLLKEEGREGLRESPDVDRGSPAPLPPHKPKGSAALHELGDNGALSAALLADAGEVVDLGECDLSIEKLNETISTLQQAILKISQQQEQLLMKSPTVPAPASKSSSQDHRVKASIHFVEPLSPTGMTGHRKAPRLGQGRNSRPGRPAELKVVKDRPQGASRSKTPTPSVEALPHLRPAAPRTPSDPAWDGVADGGSDTDEKSFLDSYRLHAESNQRALVLSSPKDTNILSEQMSLREALESGVKEAGLGAPAVSGKEDVPVDGPPRSKASLIEVDLSDLKAPDEDGQTEGPESSADLGSEADQKLGVGFFFKVKRWWWCVPPCYPSREGVSRGTIQSRARGHVGGSAQSSTGGTCRRAWPQDANVM